MRLTVIGWYLLCVAVFLSLLMCTSCAHRTYERIERDTVIVHTVDSVIVTMREVEVEVPVPQITLQERIPLCDTLMVLDNGLYTSTVDIHNGQVTHTLKPSANADGTVATIPGTVVVSDTTVHHAEHVSEVRESTEKEKVVQPTVDSWWVRFRKSLGWFVGGIVAGIVLSIVAWFVFRRKI